MAENSVKTIQVDLPAELFDVQSNVPLMHQVVVAQLAAARQGTHKTKRRGEVSGAGRPSGPTSGQMRPSTCQSSGCSLIVPAKASAT